MVTPTRRIRVEFTEQHDDYLIKYLAKYCPTRDGRRGRNVFKRLVTNEGNLWPWHIHHSWQSWRDRYVKNQDVFDNLILRCQKKHNIDGGEVVGTKRVAEVTPIEMLGPSAKRVKLLAEEVQPREQAEQSGAAQREKLTSQSSHPPSSQQSPPATQPLKSPEDSGLPSLPCTLTRTNQDATEKPPPDLSAHEAQQDTREVRPGDGVPLSPPPPSSTNAQPGGTQTSPLGLPALQTQLDTLETLSSSLERPAAIPANGEPELRSPLRTAKRVKKRARTPSDLFASETESPEEGEAVQTRAPPRVVDSFHGQVLVDRKGHVPHTLAHNGTEEEEEEEEEEKKKERPEWPPPRGHAVNSTKASCAGDEHYAFSQPQPPAAQKTSGDGIRVDEQEKSPHPFDLVSETMGEAQFNRRTVVARFTGRMRQSAIPQAQEEREQHDDATLNGALPIKPIIPSGPPLDSIPGLVPKPFPKPKFPVPHASTRSPFRSKPPVGESAPSPRGPPSPTKAARHPALVRIRRQTIGHVDEHGPEDEHRRKHKHVPSVDLVALSHSSTSVGPPSRSSAGESVPKRPPRWSLPAFALAMPWVVDETKGTRSAPESIGSGSPFRWAAPSPVYGNDGRPRHIRRSPMGTTSTPLFASSTAPTIAAMATHNSTSDVSLLAPDAPASISSISSASSTRPVVAHPSDVSLTSSHGLASILAQMAVNHELGLSVVEAVYARVRSLREADEVLRVMREAAEGFGEWEIEKLERRRQRGVRRVSEGEDRKEREMELGYVAASEDGDGSEYSPPETSRAAIWKRQEMARATEEDEGRKAQALERQMGRGRYRRDTVRRFI